MEQIRLGKTDSFVSSICLGCMYFGSKVDEETSFRLMDRYVEAGGAFLDTADCYAFWIPGHSGDESETTIGNWMQQRRNRSKIFLATKIGARPATGESNLGTRETEGLSTRAILDAVDGSLGRLRTDHVDLLYTHIPDLSVPLEVTLEALDRLRRSGKILNTGCSNELAWRVALARTVSNSHGWSSFVCVQNRFTYLRPLPRAVLPQVCVNDDLLDYVQSNGDVSIAAYSPLLGGAYSRGVNELPPEYRSQDSKVRLAALQRVAREVGSSPNATVLAWLMHGEPALIPVMASSNEIQLLENLAAVDLRLSPDHFDILNRAAG